MIELRGICKTKKDATVLHNVNLTINDGDVIAILGPSGMGRTALLSTILTLEKPTSGEIIIDGKIVGDCDFENINSVELGETLLPQEPSFWLFTPSNTGKHFIDTSGSSYRIFEMTGIYQIIPKVV